MAAVLAAGGAAEAQVDAVKVAKKLFIQGKQHYDKGQYFRSLKQFTAAMKYAPRPVILLNIAQCYRRLGLPSKALFYYEWYLSAAQKARPGRTPRFLAEVTRLVKARKELIALYKRGEQLQKEKKHKEALAVFRQAQKILPWTRVHINIAQCHLKLGEEKLARARANMALRRFRRFRAAWKRAVGKVPPSDLAELRTKIRLLEQLRRALDQARWTRLTLTGLPAGARVFVGSTPQGEAPGAASLHLPPGRHMVRVELAGHYPWSHTVLLKERARVTRKVALRRVPPPPPPAPPPPPEPERSRLLFAAGISTAALAAGAEVLALIYLAQANDLYLDDPRFLDYQSYVIAGHVTAGCMAAASAVLFYLYYRSGKEKPARRSATLQLTPLQGGGMVGGMISF